jgi:uncharacterized lipoprotein NlpE involved in copper resistance
MKKQNMIKKLFISSLFAISLIGCANKSDMKVISAGKIGCAPDKISIQNENVGVSTSSWIAKCEDKRYFCSGDDMLRSVSCKETK